MIKLNRYLYYTLTISLYITYSAPIGAALELSEEAGVECIGSEAIVETTAEIMQREEINSKIRGAEQQVVVRIHPRADRFKLPQNPDSPEASSVGDITKTLSQYRVITPAVHKVGITFTGVTFNESGFTPPDSMGAVGWNQYIVHVNGRIKSYNKCTGQPDGILNASNATFYQSVANGKRISDPRIRFDRWAKRWIAIAITIEHPNRVLFAVSNGADITSTSSWKFFYFQQNAVTPAGEHQALADYPTLGVDAHALYIGTNQFTTTSFVGSTAFVVRKSSILVNGPVVAFAFRNLINMATGEGMYTPQGVDNIYTPNPSVGYFIGVDASSLGKLVIRRVSNITTTPTLSPNIFLTVPTTLPPMDVPHLGNTAGVTGYLDGLDDRLMAAHLHGTSLWTAHSIGVNNTGVSSSGIPPTRNGCRWYQINVAPTTPTLTQAGTLYQPSANNTTDQRHYWIPTVMTSAQGHMILGCSTAGAQEFANAAFAGRLASDPLGELRTPVLYTASTTAYNPSYDPGTPGRGRRWGDYSYTSVDPLDFMSIWTIQEWCNAGVWSTKVAKILAPPPAKPVSASPATIARNRALTGVIITGQSTNGSGFFAIGGTRSLKVTITGGVEVTYAQVLSPTSIAIHINTCKAQVGAQTITITNGDGQSVTAANLITIV